MSHTPRRLRPRRQPNATAARVFIAGADDPSLLLRDDGARLATEDDRDALPLVVSSDIEVITLDGAS